MVMSHPPHMNGGLSRDDSTPTINPMALTTPGMIYILVQAISILIDKLSPIRSFACRSLKPSRNKEEKSFTR